MLVGASIGIAVFPEHGHDAETLMQRADIAMYPAKAARSGHERLQRERDGHSRDRLALIGELRDGDRARPARPALPAQARPRDRRVDGVEALVRWQHPERGLLGAGRRSSRWPSRPA